MFFLHSNHQNSIISNNPNLSTNSESVLVDFNDSGEFVLWYWVSGLEGDTLVKDGDKLLFENYENIEQWCAVDKYSNPNEASTNLLSKISLVFKISYENVVIFQHHIDITFRIYYNDSSYDTFYNFYYMIPPTSSGNTGILTENFTLDSDKYLERIWLHMNTDNYVRGKVEVYSETYYTELLPIIISIDKIPIGIHTPLEEIIFTLNVTNKEYVSECGVSIKFLETNNYHNFIGSIVWEYDFYECSYTPRYNGSYAYFGYISLGFWGIVFNTGFYTFIVDYIEYPKDSYLSLFSSLDGFPLESKEYKVYLGESEEYSLVDFREYYGNWSKIYGSSNVTMGFIDDYIRFEAINNGLKTYFEDMLGVNTFVFNTLLFEMKIENPLILTLIYNPNVIEKTYYLTLNESYVNTWYSVIIPIFNFTTYKDVYNNYLYQLGFYLNSGSMSIANIRLGKYYDVSFSIERFNYSQIIEENISENLNVTNWNNYTNTLNETNFDYTQKEMENITIVGNQTIQLAVTGNYIGEWSFTNDTLGENPTNGWYVNENNPSDVEIVNFNYHTKVIRMNQSDGNFAYAPTFEEQTSGEVEFWFYTNDDNQGHAFEIYDDNMAKALVFGVYGGVFIYISSSQPTGAPIGRGCSPFVWYRIRIVFDLAVGWYCYINGDNYSTILDYVGSPIAFNRITIWDYTMGAGNYAYYDAIDVNWSEGYFTNRNWANTYYPSGYYISKTYNLGNSTEIVYNSINWSIEQNLNTNISIQYRISLDNITYSPWSIPIYTNVSIEEIKLKYFQFTLNLTTSGNYTYIPKCFEVNLTYTKGFRYYELNYTLTITLEYNDTFRVVDKGIYNIIMNLTVFNNQSNYDLYLFNYTLKEYVIIESVNYTNEILNTSYYNISQFRIRFFVNSTVDYDFGFNLTLNNTYYEIWNNTYYISNSYRLISPENRQNPSYLLFDSDYETIVILDFFNNTLYRKLVGFSNFTDIGLSISTILFTNWYNYTLLVTIQRGLGTNIQVVIPPESSISIRIFTTSYNVEVRNEALELLNVTSISFNQTSNIILRFGERIEIEIPQFDLLSALIEFFFTTPLGFVCFCIIVLGLVVIFFDLYVNLKNYRKNRKNRKNDRKEREVRELKEEYERAGI